MIDIRRKLLASLILFSMLRPALAQTAASAAKVTPSTPSVSDANSVELEKKLETISSALAVTHEQLEQSKQQIEELKEELAQIKKQLGLVQSPASRSEISEGTADVAKATASTIEDLQEQQQTTEAQVKLHEQTKVEGSSKYPLRVTGLILFNSFLNRGNVDAIDLPSVALSNQNNTTGNGSAGASLRQTILGLEGFGPKIAGAHTSADINLDFFGGVAYSSYGTSAGLVRLRTASINLDWANDSLQVGMVGPLISPLSPTSYATVAEPGLAGAGNLWTWSQQLKYMHKIPLEYGRRLEFEFGLWDPPAAGYSVSSIIRVPSAGEASRQPGYESRISYGNSGGEHPFQIGLGGYYSRQSYSGNEGVDSWASTADWRIPIGSRFEISGEGYRGRALGGFGGGVYKDVLSGTDPLTGLSTYRGLNAAGGWTQFKARFGQSLEGNASVGVDNGFASDFHSIILPPTASATQLRARNRMAAANLIFKPKTYLILSPEYRRIWSWPINSARSTADIFTLSAGYQF